MTEYTYKTLDQELQCCLDKLKDAIFDHEPKITPPPRKRNKIAEDIAHNNVVEKCDILFPPPLSDDSIPGQASDMVKHVVALLDKHNVSTLLELSEKLVKGICRKKSC